MSKCLCRKKIKDKEENSASKISVSSSLRLRFSLMLVYEDCDTVHLLFHVCNRKFTVSIIFYRNMTVCISVSFYLRLEDVDVTKSNYNRRIL